MFIIRRFFDEVAPRNREALRQVQAILREQFPALKPEDVDKIPELLRNPLKHRFRSILYVAEDSRGTVTGFALLSHEPELHFAYLDYISAAKAATGGGIGGALYERLREEAVVLGCRGIFFECLPDDPALCRDPETLAQNRARLKFYEKYGARPIVGTAYETPVKPGDDNPPYLVFDNLGQERPLPAAEARRIVRAILERRYGHLCSPAYIDMVVTSFQDDPVLLRPPRYRRKTPTVAEVAVSGKLRRIPLVVNDQHSIHHVRERGYVEAPVRIDAILKELTPLGMFERTAPADYPERHIRAVHDGAYVDYFKKVCANLGGDRSLYPYVFPIRNQARPPKELAVRAGYYCIDTFTPINRNAQLAATRAVDCALTAADRILAGHRLAYALVRPPGHHAEVRAFGGFCYYNNAAVAAHYLSRFGPIAMLDIDYHHGNGQQVIFYGRKDVLTVSLHGHPSFAYPYFSGFEDEKGEGEGLGFNRNYPLPETIDFDLYLKTLDKALRKIRIFQPSYLVLCLGLDTAKGDPTGTWPFTAANFEVLGRRIGALRLPTLVVQEGGYYTRRLGVNARNFFVGLWSGAFPQEKDS
ncbi:histone deacetylase family protein [Trichloromonas sp.]|uniref:histone deacetylase family protein n=1 Tax=Trichloromonas sp. TaxID=3069249 RepID=UPI002A462EC6|nr:histone deacetylase family protein [Trichloromonas sp.]